MEVVGHGKFRYESNKTRGGRIYIPSGITTSPNFPFKNGYTVKITLTDKGYLILENYKNMRIEPIKPECETCSFTRIVEKLADLSNFIDYISGRDELR